MSKPLFLILFPIIIFLTFPELFQSSIIIKDILEIPKGTIKLYAYIKVNQTFTLRLKSNHIAGNEWHLLNPEQLISCHIHPLNLNETTRSVPMHKLDNYPQKINDDVYYDFQFRATEHIHQDLTIEIAFKAKQYCSTLKTYPETRILVLNVQQS